MVLRTIVSGYLHEFLGKKLQTAFVVIRTPWHPVSYLATSFVQIYNTATQICGRKCAFTEYFR